MILTEWNEYRSLNLIKAVELMAQKNIFDCRNILSPEQATASGFRYRNQDDRQLFIDKKIVNKEKTVLLPGSGVDLARFQPTPKTQNEKFIFLLVGRLLIDKGIIEYLQAAEILSDRDFAAEFWLIGKLDENNGRSIAKETLERYQQSNIINYLGFNNDIRPYLAQVDCVVLPSYCEGVPRVLLEAAAMAKPVVTADSVGCRDAVMDQVTDFLCRARDAADLAVKMETMLSIRNRITIVIFFVLRYT